MAKSSSPSPASFERFHASLLEDLPRLEQSMGRDSWAQALCAELKEMRTNLLEHFRTEEEGGYMETIRTDNPRLETRVAHLAEEHRCLAGDLDQIIGAAGDMVRLEQELSSRLQQWIAKLRDHEARETDLVQDAFNQDIGNKD